jgi:hypothetical protein
MDQIISRQFQVALEHFLQEEGRGAQTRLAAAKDIDRGYLNSIVKGRQAGSDKTRTKIADHFETTFEDMLAFGRQILVEKGELVPKEREGFGQRTGASFPGTSKPQGKSLQIDNARISDETIVEAILKTLDVLQEASAHSETLIRSINVIHEAVVLNKQNTELNNQLMEIASRVSNIEGVLADTKTVPLKLRKTFRRSIAGK